MIEEAQSRPDRSRQPRFAAKKRHPFALDARHADRERSL